MFTFLSHQQDIVILIFHLFFASFFFFLSSIYSSFTSFARLYSSALPVLQNLVVLSSFIVWISVLSLFLYCILLGFAVCSVHELFLPPIFLLPILTYYSSCYLYFSLVCCLTVSVRLYSTPRFHANFKLLQQAYTTSNTEKKSYLNNGVNVVAKLLFIVNRLVSTYNVSFTITASYLTTR
jgi:hypothetical protein